MPCSRCNINKCKTHFYKQRYMAVSQYMKFDFLNFRFFNSSLHFFIEIGFHLGKICSSSEKYSIFRKRSLSSLIKKSGSIIVLLLFGVFGSVIISSPLILCADLLTLIGFLSKSKSAFVNALNSPNRIPVQYRISKAKKYPYT